MFFALLLLGLVSAASGVSWKPISQNTDPPDKRFGVMGVLYDDVYMYIFGGRSSTRFYNDLWRFHLRQREWEVVEPRTDVVPSERAFHSVETHGPYIFVLGGQRADGRYTFDYWRWDIENEIWEDLTPLTATLPPVRAFFGGVMFRNEYHVFGGKATNDSEITLGDYQVFNAHSRDPDWAEVFPQPLLDDPVAPSPRYGHAMVVVGTKIFMFGGYDESRIGSEAYMNEMWAWNPLVAPEDEGGIVRVKPENDAPVGRAFHRIFADETIIYVAGGFSSEGKHLDDLWAYDTTTNEWEEVIGASGGDIHLLGASVMFNDGLRTKFVAWGGAVGDDDAGLELDARNLVMSDDLMGGITSQLAFLMLIGLTLSFLACIGIVLAIATFRHLRRKRLGLKSRTEDEEDEQDLKTHEAREKEAKDREAALARLRMLRLNREHQRRQHLNASGISLGVEAGVQTSAMMTNVGGTRISITKEAAQGQVIHATSVGANPLGVDPSTKPGAEDDESLTYVTESSDGDGAGDEKGALANRGSAAPKFGANKTGGAAGGRRGAAPPLRRRTTAASNSNHSSESMSASTSIEIPRGRRAPRGRSTAPTTDAESTSFDDSDLSS